MVTVVFTGVAPLGDYMKDRPREYEALKNSGELRKRVVTGTSSKRSRILIRAFGYGFLSLGVILILLIMHSVLFGYR
ncbi:MAG: hypothetical protein ACE5EO_04125 [Candidatus Krumholzibacteriia bacterium]